MWHVLLAIPIIPAVFGGIILALFFYESPRALLIKDKNEDKARKGLKNIILIPHRIQKFNQSKISE